MPGLGENHQHHPLSRPHPKGAHSTQGLLEGLMNRLRRVLKHKASLAESTHGRSGRH